MSAPEKKRDAAPESSQEPLAEADKSGQPDLAPSNPGGKALTACPEQIEGCTEDTITDGDGSYLEPPD